MRTVLRLIARLYVPISPYRIKEITVRTVLRRSCGFRTCMAYMIKEITVRTVLRLGRRAGKHLDIGIKEITVRTVLRQMPWHFLIRS